MKVFQVEDEHSQIIEAVLDGISRCPEDSEIDCFVFGIVYEDQRYSTGYYNASPADISKVAGYLQLDASLRYVKLNKEELEKDEDEV
jgi:hypothetical protein